MKMRASVSAKRRVGFLAFDGVQALDLIGPADAFGSDALTANDDAAPSLATASPYEIVIVGLTGRRFTSSCGVTMNADVAAHSGVKLDTVIVPGGRGLRRGDVSERAARWIVSRAAGIRRIASVCTGIYGLAPTRLLNGRSATTHWAAVSDVRRRFPEIDLDADAIFLKSGKYYTSAGITAGIDLALALIEEDLGPEASLAVAREMVVYVKREGGQAQFSEPLQYQVQTTDRLRDLPAWIDAHLREELSVEVLAARTNLSPRQFARVFHAEFGATPAAFVQAVRLGEASRRLASPRTRANVSEIARSVGYSNVDVFRRAFERRFGVPPRQYRKRFTP